MSLPGKESLQGLLSRAEQGPVPTAEIAWLAAIIDHTSLKPEVTKEQLRQLCTEAREHQFGAVCVRVNHVAFCVKELEGSGVKVAAVVGFHTGRESTEKKMAETREAVRRGAAEIDMVMNWEKLRTEDSAGVYSDIHQVVLAAGKVPVKVILETSQLGEEEKLQGATLAKAAGAAFLKTSTGFVSGGATMEDVALLRSVAKEQMGVKASGGVRSLVDALRMVLAGANRIGTSSGVTIVSGKSPQEKQSGVY